MSAGRVWTADAAAVAAARDRLTEILVDCVEHGASIGFVSPFGRDEADAYWRRIEAAVAAGRCILLLATGADGELAGTVQLDVDTFPNQRHRGTVAKLLVHTAARRQGLGEALMAGLEQAAAADGRWLLTLDTATEDAARLYRRLGWSLSGVIPCYALNPDGSLTDTAFYWKELPAARAAAGAV